MLISDCISDVCSSDLADKFHARRTSASKQWVGGDEMAGTGWETASRPRHAELVSASMAEPLTLRCAEGNGRPWTLKQVQGDEEREAASGRFPTFPPPDRSEERRGGKECGRTCRSW